MATVRKWLTGLTAERAAVDDGKATLFGAISETTPLRTEELITEAGVGVDNLAGVEQKTTTTVAMDFGRITLSSALVVYLFGAPGQDRFWFMWDDLSRDRESVKTVLLALLEHVMRGLAAEASGDRQPV